MTSTAADNLDDATVSRVTRNLELVRRFAMEIVANPRVMEEVPSGEVVLIPDDDPELAASNIEGGMRRVHERSRPYLLSCPGSRHNGASAGSRDGVHTGTKREESFLKTHVLRTLQLQHLTGFRWAGDVD